MPSFRRHLVCAALALAGLSGCGSDGADPAGSEEEGPRVQLGTGRTVFEPLPEDGRVTLIAGIQGGFHVWTSFVAEGFSSSLLRMDLATRWDAREDSSMSVSGSITVRPARDAAGDEVLGMIGWPAGIFNPTCANGQRLRVDVSVEDVDGRSASDSRHWYVDVPEEHRSSDCAP